MTKGYLIVLLTVIFFSSALSQAQLVEGFEGPDNIPTSSGSAPVVPTVFTTPTGAWVFLKAYKSNSTNTSKIGTYMGRLLNNAAAGGSYMISPRMNTVDSILFKSLRDRTYKIYLSTDSLHFTLRDSQSIKTGFYYKSRANEGSKTVWVKIANEAGNDTDIDSVVITKTPATASVISASADVLDTFGPVVAGQNSLVQSYAVSGVNLTEGVLVSAPVGFLVSKNNSDFSTTITLAQAGGILVDTTVFVRFSPAFAVGTLAAAIIHTSTGANARSTAVNGIAIAQEPTVQSSLQIQQVTGTSISLRMNGGSCTGRILIARRDSAVSWLPTDGIPMAGINSSFPLAFDNGDGNRVVYVGSDTAVIVAGLLTGTRYHFLLVDYNAGTQNSQNYRTSATVSADTTTSRTAGMSVTPASLAFGSVLLNTVSKEQILNLSAQYLSPTAGMLTVTAPAELALSVASGSGFSSSLQLPYMDGTVNGQKIYVRFTPSVLSGIADSIHCSGGGAPSMFAPVTGKGVNEVAAADSVPFGFASCGGGTTGGLGGSSIVVTTGVHLAAIMLPREKNITTPLILYISGTVTGASTEVSFKRTQNITILGLGNDATLQGFGLKLVDARNIIIRNIAFKDCKVGENDAIAVESSSNIWVDHCSFTDSPSIDLSGSSHDGLLDIKKGSTNVTISWNHFMNHRKTCLLGHSVSETGDTALRVTYYCNWFDGTYSRHPRARYGKAHILNNLYTSVGVVGADADGYGVGATCGASLLVESNYFENTPTPVLISQVNDPGETLSGDPMGFVKSSNNYLSGSGPAVENLSGYLFNPSESYTYAAREGQTVKDIVKAGAGSGIVDIPTAVSRNARSSSLVPAEIILEQNFPNPFNPTTSILYQLSRACSVTLKVYDQIGREAATLVQGTQSAGTYQVNFDASSLSSGLYYYRLQAGNLIITKKLVLLK